MAILHVPNVQLKYTQTYDESMEHVRLTLCVLSYYREDHIWKGIQPRDTSWYPHVLHENAMTYTCTVRLGTFTESNTTVRHVHSWLHLFECG